MKKRRVYIQNIGKFMKDRRQQCNQHVNEKTKYRKYQEIENRMRRK